MLINLRHWYQILLLPLTRRPGGSETFYRRDAPKMPGTRRWQLIPSYDCPQGQVSPQRRDKQRSPSGHRQSAENNPTSLNGLRNTFLLSPSWVNLDKGSVQERSGFQTESFSLIYHQLTVDVILKSLPPASGDEELFVPTSLLLQHS